jgi:hypothetical protein
MTSISYYYSVLGSWIGPADEAPAITGAKFLKTLDSLSGIDPIFADWQINRNWEIEEDGQPRLIPLAAARRRIADIVEGGVTRDDFDEPEPIYGYSVLATAGARGPRQVAFSAWTGNRMFKLSFGEWFLASDLSIVTYPLYKAALLVMSEVWGAQYAYASAFRNEVVKTPMDLASDVPAFTIESALQVPIDPTFPKSMFHVPWIIYLSAKHAAGVKVAREIPSEHTPDGGLVISATADRIDPMNPTHVRGARILAEILIACKGASSS